MLKKRRDEDNNKKKELFKYIKAMLTGILLVYKFSRIK